MGSRFFYEFLGLHSFLIGLLPFFLPVYLWQHGLGLVGLCVLLGFSGIGFCLALNAWQQMAARVSVGRLVGFSFVLELCLIGSVYVFAGDTVSTAGIVTIGLLNGFYNAFFWTTQRTLFAGQLGDNDTGRKFGNFQIFVTIILKIGILAGGFLLDHGGLVWLLILSALISLAGAWRLATHVGADKRLPAIETVSLIHSLSFRDQRGSRPVFLVDGIFLYLESHFWTISLFLFVHEDFARLGLVVVILALVFSVLFFLIKNTIDRVSVEMVYRWAVVVYALSWALRYFFDSSIVLLILITFCSSFFRLAFNKRFFDVVTDGGGLSYLLVKSYASQFWLAIGFFLFGASVWLLDMNPDSGLGFAYLLATMLAFTYLLYRRN